MRAPADPSLHKLAFAVAVVARRQDFGNNFAFHHLAKLDRRGVGFGIVHPPSHIRLERQVLGLEQKLAIGGIGQRSGLEAKINQGWPALRAFDKNDLATSVHLDIPPRCPPTAQAVRITSHQR
jgi:hypothetical protein